MPPKSGIVFVDSVGERNMTFRVIFYRDGERLADAAWTGSLAEAQNVMKESINKCSYDHVEILNDKGVCVLKHDEPDAVMPAQ